MFENNTFFLVSEFSEPGNQVATIISAIAETNIFISIRNPRGHRSFSVIKSDFQWTSSIRRQKLKNRFVHILHIKGHC